MINARDVARKNYFREGHLKSMMSLSKDRNTSAISAVDGLLWRKKYIKEDVDCVVEKILLIAGVIELKADQKKGKGIIVMTAKNLFQLGEWIAGVDLI